MSAHIWWPSNCGHLSSSPGVLRRMAYLVPVVAGCDCSWLFWLPSATQAASCSAGVRMPMAECGRMVPTQWDPLGGGDHWRRRCPPKGPGYGSARPCTRSSEPRPEQSRKESPFDSTEATASHSARAARSRWTCTAGRK